MYNIEMIKQIITLLTFKKELIFCELIKELKIKEDSPNSSLIKSIISNAIMGALITGMKTTIEFEEKQAITIQSKENGII